MQFNFVFGIYIYYYRSRKKSMVRSSWVQRHRMRTLSCILEIYNTKVFNVMFFRIIICESHIRYKSESVEAVECAGYGRDRNYLRNVLRFVTKGTVPSPCPLYSYLLFNNIFFHRLYIYLMSNVAPTRRLFKWYFFSNSKKCRSYTDM